MNPELPGVNMYITTCLHGVDLRFTPRCYLCKPWPEDSPVFTINPSGGHRHEGEWCAKCVEHGEAATPAPLDARYAAQLNLTIKANSTIEDLREELHAAHEHRRVVEEYMAAPDPAPLDVDEVERTLLTILPQSALDAIRSLHTAAQAFVGEYQP